MVISTQISLGALAIAFSALAVSIWSAAISRRHNRLSVRPHLKVDYLHEPDEPLRILLANTGIGPAVFQSFDVQVDGSNTIMTQGAGLREAFGRLGLVGSFYGYVPSEGDALGAGESRELLRFEAGPAGSSESNDVQLALARLSIRVKYESMYGEEFLLQRRATGLD